MATRSTGAAPRAYSVSERRMIPSIITANPMAIRLLIGSLNSITEDDINVKPMTDCKNDKKTKTM
jgi:hypothetical protein